MSIARLLSGRFVFVDAGAYAAFALVRDANHDRAMATFEELARDRRQLVTTNFVIAEAHALVLARAGRDLAAETLDWIDRSPATKVRITEEDELRAREIIRRYRDKDFSLTDATSFAVMERFGITHAVAFDRHFIQYGFQVISAE